VRARPEQAAEVVAEHEKQRRELERAAKEQAAHSAVDPQALAAGAEDVAGVPVVVAQVALGDAKQLPDAVDRVKGKLGGDGVVLLASVVEDRVALVVSVGPSLVGRGLDARAIVKAAATLVGGGGGGRDTLAQAGGRDPQRVGEALSAGRAAIGEALS
jgi:alanyl-tRNA synthetase